jgi:hypothetical protein
VVVGGADVWEIISALRSAPEHGQLLIPALAERLGASEASVRIATRYYGEYPDDIDTWIEINDAEAEELEAALERERALLG